MRVVLGNKAHPEYGVTTIPFPIRREEYSHTLELLSPLEIGDPIRQDCQVIEVTGHYTVLNHLAGSEVNLDELDYLAKRLDSFDIGEAAQFQAMAEKLGLDEIRDFINLTFCCQQTTVITDFSDLGKVGREHYMNLNGGCARVKELDELDGEKTARLLIESGGGTVTPYGVVYDNNMKLQQLYDGRVFPEYLYDASVIAVEVGPINTCGKLARSTWLFLPMPEEQIGRMLHRAGISGQDELQIKLAEHELPKEIIERMHIPYENLYDLNRMCEVISPMTAHERGKLAAVVLMAKPEYAREICRLAENLDQFEFIEGINTAAEYGRYMIQDSGRFEYDSDLDEFYDYEKYGKQRMEREYGEFNSYGYVAYYGTMSLDDLMMEDPAEEYRQGQDFQMGGIK